MITLRHRSASGDLGSMWEWDTARGVLELVFRLGAAAPIAITLTVCHPDHPKFLAHPIVRLDGERWRVLPSMYVPAFSVSRDRYRFEPRQCGRASGVGASIPCDLHAALGRPSHLILAHAPADQDAELEALGA